MQGKRSSLKPKFTNTIEEKDSVKAEKEAKKSKKSIIWDNNIDIIESSKKHSKMYDVKYMEDIIANSSTF